MARTYAIPTIKDDNDLAVVNAWCRAIRLDTQALVEGQYTDRNGDATFTTLPDDVDCVILCTWIDEAGKERTRRILSECITAVNAINIGTNVTNITTLDGKVTTCESDIIQNAENILLKVSETDYNGTEICSKINLTSGAVVIEAQHIELNGIVAVAADIKSSNYSAGLAGWQIKGDGDAEFNDVIVRGAIHAGVGSVIDFGYVDNGPPANADKTSTSNQPYDWLTGSKPPIDAEANPSYIHSTYISATEIISPVIRAGEIKVGYTLEVKGAISAGGGNIILDNSGLSISGQIFKLIHDGYSECTIYNNMGSLFLLPGTNVMTHTIKPSVTNAYYCGTSSAVWNVGYFRDLYATRQVILKEVASTPANIANYGQLYTADTNRLYFKDGDGTIHVVAFLGD